MKSFDEMQKEMDDDAKAFAQKIERDRKLAIESRRLEWKRELAAKMVLLVLNGATMSDVHHTDALRIADFVNALDLALEKAQ